MDDEELKHRLRLLSPQPNREDQEDRADCWFCEWKGYKTDRVECQHNLCVGHCPDCDKPQTACLDTLLWDGSC